VVRVSQEGDRPGSQDSKAVYQISEARPGLSEDISNRTRRYVISMGIRTVCFPIAVFTEGWVRWMFVAAALLVPYFAVILANAGRERVDALPPTPLLNSQLALPPGASPIIAPDDVDGFLRAAGVAPPPPDDRPGPTDWQRRASA
jgi:Protein of unknown function (DUF3099)